MMAQLKTKDRSAYEVDLITKIMHLLERYQHKLTFMSATPIPIRFFRYAYNKSNPVQNCTSFQPRWKTSSPSHLLPSMQGASFLAHLWSITHRYGCNRTTAIPRECNKE